MFKEAMRPVWTEINLSNFDYNIKQIKAKVSGGAELIGVIKADAYGHGSIKCAEVLRANGVKTFAVATVQEAATLRAAGAKEEIICLGLVPDLFADDVVKYDVTPVVCSAENALAYNEAAAKAGKNIGVIIAVDTGMGRIGYQADDPETAIADIKKYASLPNLHIEGMFSHFSTADAYDKTYSHGQQEKFDSFYKALTDAGIKVPMRTLANSAAIMELPGTHYEKVRPGIILYGLYPSDEVDRNQLSIKPVMSVKASIVHLKDVPANFSVGYGRKYISKKPAKIATINLGYADGYPRPYSPVAKVIVDGCIAPIAGNICMDQCMIDVTDVPGVKVGDEVIVMGSDGKNEISAEDIAKATGTISYEIVCAFGQRLPKVYVK
ncbi:MAG: alanine racemase [Eubacterium sp.]|jgi:alanine racemase